MALSSSFALNDSFARRCAGFALAVFCGALGAAAPARAQVPPGAPDAGAPSAAAPDAGAGATVLGDPTPADATPAPPPSSEVPAPPPPSGYGPPGAAQPQPGYGQPGYGQPGYGQPLPPAEQASPPPAPHARNDDANADHVVVGPTALTAPKGSIYFSSNELVLVQGGVAITDNFQLTLTTLIPLVPDQGFFGDLSAKLAFLQSPRFHLAAIGSVLVLTGFDSSNALVVGRASLVGTACLTEDCYYTASASAMFWFNENISEVVPITLNLGLTARVAGIFSLLLEANFLGAAGDVTRGGADIFTEGFLLGYGVRFSNGNFGFDLTFLKPFIEDFEFPLVLGVPWLAFTYRSDALF